MKMKNKIQIEGRTLYNVKGVQEVFGVCERTIFRWMEEKKLKGVKFGYVWFFYDTEVEKTKKLMR